MPLDKGGLRELVRQCYWFLVRFVRKFKENQMLLADEVPIFLKAVQLYPSAGLLVKEIFANNKKLLTEAAEGTIKEILTIAEKIP